MNISLSPELETMIREKVETGAYHDANEVVGQAMRALAKYEEALRYRQVLEAALVEAAASLDRGEGIELTDEEWDRIIAEADEMSDDEPLDPLVTGEL